VEGAIEHGNPDTLVFEAEQVLERVEKLGDLYEPVLTMKQKVPELAKV
jgi:bifunctional non-homologous end joining protein LigD